MMKKILFLVLKILPFEATLSGEKKQIIEDNQNGYHQDTNHFREEYVQNKEIFTIIKNRYSDKKIF